MSIRKTPLVTGETYHIYNRGIDKRTIFENKLDYKRFLDSILELNTENPSGGLFHKHILEKKGINKNLENNKPIELIAYCLNPNHFHLIVKQLSDNGISKFMHRLGTGYTQYFNNQNDRTGSLFQGKFKSKHIDTNEYLFYLSAYVNLNDQIHKINNEHGTVFSSLEEYTKNIDGVCEKNIILDQYNGKQEYAKFLDDSLPELIRQKEQSADLEA